MLWFYLSKKSHVVFLYIELDEDSVKNIIRVRGFVLEKYKNSEYFLLFWLNGRIF
jgi:hypothetical protein